MGYGEILSRAKRLPLDEQLRLTQELLRGMCETVDQPAHPKQQGIILLKQLWSVLKAGGPAPTDSDLEDAYSQHQAERY
jgi:hypothetical protein